MSKTKLFVIIFILILGSISFAYFLKNRPIKINIHIYSEMTQCSSWLIGVRGEPYNCPFINIDGGKKEAGYIVYWIDGFKYEKNKEYDLVIKKEQRKDPIQDVGLDEGYFKYTIISQ